MERTIIEEIRVSGEDLLRRVKEIIRKGNVRRLIIRNSEGKKLIETSLTFGAAGIGSMILLTPFLSAITFIALMVSEAQIVVERDADEKEVEAEDIEIVEE